jgi:uncharacterized repeat protein (TIGR04076 family)
MWKVKVTVIKTFIPEDVFGHELSLPTGERIHKCEYFKEGQEFVVDTVMKMPEGFCTWAWYDLYKDISVLSFGGGSTMGPGLQFTACSDGKRPVCFRLERLDERAVGY